MVRVVLNILIFRIFSLLSRGYFLTIFMKNEVDPLEVNMVPNLFWFKFLHNVFNLVYWYLMMLITK